MKKTKKQVDRMKVDSDLLMGFLSLEYKGTTVTFDSEDIRKACIKKPQIVYLLLDSALDEYNEKEFKMYEMMAFIERKLEE